MLERFACTTHCFFSAGAKFLFFPCNPGCVTSNLFPHAKFSYLHVFGTGKRSYVEVVGILRGPGPDVGDDVRARRMTIGSFLTENLPDGPYTDPF